MSHEMLTPLNSIINLAMFVEQKIKKQSDLEMEMLGGRGSTTVGNFEIRTSLNYLHIIKSSANMMQLMLKNLIDMNYIRQDKFA